MVKIKICGLSDVETALATARAGADMLGFVFATSKRQVTPQEAKAIISQLPSSIGKVGVFVNEDIKIVNEIAEYCGLDMVQLHGQETPEYCQAMNSPVLKAIAVRDENSLSVMAGYQVRGFLLDSFHPQQIGGSGTTFDWRLVNQAKQYGPVIVAGGLTENNVQMAIELTQPYGVDVSSGVEINGKKDIAKICDFISMVRGI